MNRQQRGHCSADGVVMCRRIFAVLALLLISGAGIAAREFGRVFSGGTGRGSSTIGPCDIYGNGGTPCVAAHSTTRALYASYNGPLYQVTRASDSTTRDIGLLSAGGFANGATQDSFCAGTTCTITKIYDQSPQHNDLTVAAHDSPANATDLHITISGHSVYGVYCRGAMGYDNRGATGTATGAEPEGMYIVTSAIPAPLAMPGACCFDYGNAERTQTNDGPATMDAIFFGTTLWFGPTFYGAGPWVADDMEQGWFFSDVGYSTNPSDKGVLYDFVTAIIKNDGTTRWTRKTGNAQSGGLTTWFDGPLPIISGFNYSPLRKEGGIILGTGGDNSSGVPGYFFEGVMVFGMPTDATEDAIHANIVSAGYGS